MEKTKKNRARDVTPEKKPEEQCDAKVQLYLSKEGKEGRVAWSLVTAVHLGAVEMDLWEHDCLRGVQVPYIRVSQTEQEALCIGA
jgi:hypothetical protein